MKKILGAREHDMSLQEACAKAIRGNVLPKKAAVELEKLLLLLRSIANEKPGPAMKRVFDEIKYEEYIKSFAENDADIETRLENIREMIYDASQKETIADYLEDAALIRDAQDSEDGKRGIRLSTIHAAKGLEFEVVFVVALEEGLLPHQRSIISDNSAGSEDGIEEERRLMYVAMTRASERLHLTSSQTRRGEYSMPSRFLDEIPADLMESD